MVVVRVVPFFCAALVVALAIACSDGSTATTPDATDASSDAKHPSTDSGDPGNQQDDAATAKTTCSITKDYVVNCGSTDDLNCGDKFDDWCAANDQTINSDAFRRAEEACLVADNCDAKKRRDCEYTHESTATSTSAQTALVTAYCNDCQPDDPTGCAAKAIHYDPAAGIDSVGDIFIAARELADPIVQEITTKCTGLGGGADAGSCVKAFSTCSGDVYLAHVPDCPK